MSDYISKEWIKNAIHNFFRGLNHTVTEEDIQAYLDATPNADVRENIHGVWITNELNANYSPFDTSQEHLIRCSVCHNVANWKYDYCPNCGADMRGKQNE